MVACHNNHQATTAQECAQKVIEDALTAYRHNITAKDLLRELQHQSELLLETERVRDQLTADPFENLKDLRSQIDRIGQELKVTSVNRKVTLSGYSRIDAVVEIPVKRRTAGVKTALAEQVLKLYFQYERQAEQPKHSVTRIDPGEHPPSLWYSIDVAFGKIAPKERVLWVQVFADGNRPTSQLKAQDLEGDNDEEHGWEDVDDDDDEGMEDVGENTTEQESKRQRRDSNTLEKSESLNKTEQQEEKGKINTDEDENEERSDRFVAAMDPEVLHKFLDWLELGHADEDTAFFLLMTFPFYEHEWDIVDYILRGVFGLCDETG